MLQDNKMDQNYERILKEKKKYTGLILMIVSAFLLILIYGDLKGFFGKRGLVGLICIFTSILYFIWKDDLKSRGFSFGFRRSKSVVNQQKYTPRVSGSVVKEFNRSLTPQLTASSEDKNQNKNIFEKRQQFDNNYDMSNSQSQQQMSNSNLKQDNQIYLRYPQNDNLNSQSYNQRQQQNKFDNRLESQSTLYQGKKQQIQSKRITEVRKWGNKTSHEGNGLYGVVSQYKEMEIPEVKVGRNSHIQNHSISSQQNQLEKTRNERDALFEFTLKKQSEFQTIDQLTNAIQKAKIYVFHIIKETSSAQLKNILEINKLLFEQFNLILTEAELAQTMIQELENRYDLVNSDKKRITIDDLYLFKNTFQNSKHSIWPLPYDHQINLELINQLIEMIETRENLDLVLEVKGYNFFEIRTHILVRLFYMYSAQDCEDDQKKYIQDKFPTDIEIVSHCLFLNINEICQQQKDLGPCKIETFEVHNEQKLIPCHDQHSERFFFLVCNKLNCEPYYMFQVGKEIIYSIQGPLSFFNALVYYFVHLKNNIFPSLSFSECKEILESPAKYILNYEHEYRKGFDRYYV